jgi:hypothetical protein
MPTAEEPVFAGQTVRHIEGFSFGAPFRRSIRRRRRATESGRYRQNQAAACSLMRLDRREIRSKPGSKSARWRPRGQNRRSRVLDPSTLTQHATPTVAPTADSLLPSLVVAIDGSHAEVDVRNRYPGAKVGYCSVASVVLNLAEVERLDAVRPVNPSDFRRTEDPSSDASALPGCNVITRDHLSAKDSFRESIFELFHDAIIDEEDNTRLLTTFQALLAYKPTGTIACPYPHLGCDQQVSVAANLGTCPCERRKPLFPTDSLRIHERFNDDAGSNGEAFGYVLSVWERLLLIHLLRCFEQRDWLDRLNTIAFFVDGPLAIFGPPAWLSAAINSELQRLNVIVRKKTGNDVMIVGIEKSGKRAPFPNGSS